MKPTQWVPAIMAAECFIGMFVAANSGNLSQAVYWAGATVLNLGLAIQ